MKNSNFDKTYKLFNNIYQDNVADIINQMEKLRKKALLKFVLKTFLLFFVVPFIIFLVLLYINVIAFMVLVSLFLFPIPIGMICYIALFIYYCKKANRNFTKEIKKLYLEQFLSAFGKIRWCCYENKLSNVSEITDSCLYNSGLFIDFNARYIDDEFSGKHNGINFAVSESTLCEKHDTSKGTIEVKTFKGIIIRFLINKEIKARTIISTKYNSTQKNLSPILLVSPLFFLFGAIILYLEHDPMSVLSLLMFIAGIVAIIISLKKNLNEYKQINLESSDFMKRFDVSSSDQVESRYLVTPTFMQRLMDLKTSFGTKTIKCSFFGNCLMLAISTNKNLFELGSLFKSYYNKDSLKSFFNEFESIINMIEYFKLDERTGL